MPWWLLAAGLLCFAGLLVEAISMRCEGMRFPEASRVCDPADFERETERELLPTQVSTPLQQAPSAAPYC